MHVAHEVGQTLESSRLSKHRCCNDGNHIVPQADLDASILSRPGLKLVLQGEESDKFMIHERKFSS